MLRIADYTSRLKPIPDDRTDIKRGDIVWGRCLGHGWWPGRVTSVRRTAREATVSWSHSPTSSTVPLTQLDLFLPHFKKRFVTHKTGGYLKAVCEAQKEWGEQFGLLDSPLETDE